MSSTTGALLSELMSQGEAHAGLHEVVAAVLIRDRRVLLCHRVPERRWYPNVWDLAGGHVENGELGEEALARELQEELGIVIASPIGPPLAVISDIENLSLAIYEVKNWVGEPVNRVPEEHDEIGWFRADEVPRLALAHPTLVSLIASAMG